MLELFARSNKKVNLDFSGYLIPIHIDDDISSLSAILLNKEYYSFLLEGRKSVNGITVLDAEHIIPLKMRAWVDLQRQKSEGKHVNDKDIRKHRQDVFRLYPLFDTDTKVIVPNLVYEDIQIFIQVIGNSDFDLKTIHLPYEKSDILQAYRSIYIKNYNSVDG